jgi:hypothetical protein
VWRSPLERTTSAEDRPIDYKYPSVEAIPILCSLFRAEINFGDAKHARPTHLLYSQIDHYPYLSLHSIERSLLMVKSAVDPTLEPGQPDDLDGPIITLETALSKLDYKPHQARYDTASSLGDAYYQRYKVFKTDNDIVRAIRYWEDAHGLAIALRRIKQAVRYISPLHLFPRSDTKSTLNRRMTFFQSLPTHMRGVVWMQCTDRKLCSMPSIITKELSSIFYQILVVRYI